MGMTEHDRILDAFRNCITEPKCKDCPWAECEELDNRKIGIPADLALAVMRELAAQEPAKPVPGYWDRCEPLFNCGACGEEIGAEGIAKYCYNCGRAVKWE